MVLGTILGGMMSSTPIFNTNTRPPYKIIVTHITITNYFPYFLAAAGLLVQLLLVPRGAIGGVLR